MPRKKTQNQALEQTRDSVLRYGEVVGCELLNLVVRQQEAQSQSRVAPAAFAWRPFIDSALKMLESRTLLPATEFTKRPSWRIAWLLLASALVALVICVTATLYEQTSLRKTIRAIERSGGEVTCRFECDSRLAFLQPLLSPLFGEVIEVSLAYSNVTDSELASLKVFPKLWSLDLSGTKITDPGLQHLYGLNSLEYVDLVNVEGVSQIGIDDLQKAKPRCWIYCGEPDPGPPGR